MKQLSFLFLVFLSITFGYAQDFTVDYYSVEITVHEEGYFDVVESYDLTFTSPKHGIYRDIQTKYDLLTEAGNQEIRKIKINKVDVPGHKFKTPFQFEQNLTGTYQIKIGDKDKSVIGAQHYEIKYRVHNAFLYETDGIKFYWNLKPSDWQATFRNMEFKIYLPSSIAISPNDVFVYSGFSGTNTPSQDIDFIVANGVIEGKSKSGFYSNYGESVTLLINLPPNSIAEVKPFWPFWTDYGWTFILVILLGTFYKTWVRYGKDDKVVSITSYFPPDGMDPAMAGYLIDDSDDVYDLIALIPYWGSKGILRIEEIPKKGWFTAADTKLIALKALPDDASSYEKTIFEGLFGNAIIPESTEVLISSLKDKFYTSMSSARSSLVKQAQPYYDSRAKRARNITYGALAVLALIFAPLLLFTWGIIAMISYVLVTMFLLFMNKHMIKKNTEGNAALSELKGFRQFIKVAELNKLKMLIAEDPHYFETTMGYALAFGLFDKWANKFDALHVPPPTWYSTTSTTPLTMNRFSNSFANTMATTRSTMVSSPSKSSSSGGGSSGGGFGGGGGGSW